MNTSAISSPVHLAPGNSNAAKPADAEEGASFGQVLSREIAATPKANGPDSTQQKQPAHAADRPGNAESSSTAAKTSEPNAADKTTKASNTDGPKPNMAQAGATDAKQDAVATTSSAAEDLLALVASLTQAATGRADPETTGQTADDTPTGADVDIVDAQTQQAGHLPTLATLVPIQQAVAQEVSVAVDAADGVQASANSPSLATAGTNTGRARAESIHALHDQIAPGRARAGAMQSLNDRAQLDAAANDAAPETQNPDARLTQPGDARNAADQFAAKAAAADAAASDKAEAAHPRFAAAEGSFAKSLQDVQPAGSMPTALGASAPAQLQAAGMHPAQAAPGQFADRLAPRVGTPGWDQALGQKVIWMVGGELQTASLTLNPPDLGPLQVVLTVSENQATANFTAAQAEVRQALEAAMPKLREMLDEAGIQLGQANVSAGTRDDRPNTSAQSDRSGEGAPAQNDNAEPQVRTSRIISGGQGLVDTFA